MTIDTEQEVKPCEFVNGVCVNCEATEREECEGWICPPQRPWVGLTDADLEFWTEELGRGELGRGVLRAVAEHLREKNA